MRAAHVGGQAGLESSLVAWRVTACHRLLDVVVEEFIRIVLGSIRGQVEEFDLIGMVVHPGGDPARLMDRQVVDDDEQLARGLADQATQEAQENRRVEGTS